MWSLHPTVAAGEIEVGQAGCAHDQRLDGGTFRITRDMKVAGHLFRKGTYRMNAIGVSCEVVIGKYGLFDQFLSQEESAPLPRPWRFLSEAVGAPKFSAAPGVGFRAQWLSD